MAQQDRDGDARPGEVVPDRVPEIEATLEEVRRLTRSRTGLDLPPWTGHDPASLPTTTAPASMPGRTVRSSSVTMPIAETRGDGAPKAPAGRDAAAPARADPKVAPKPAGEPEVGPVGGLEAKPAGELSTGPAGGAGAEPAGGPATRPAEAPEAKPAGGSEARAARPSGTGSPRVTARPAAPPAAGDAERTVLAEPPRGGAGTLLLTAAERVGEAGAAAEMPDEERLRTLVQSIVREELRAELRGDLGLGLTRTVRKLVRQEVHRAIAGQEIG